MKKLFLFLSLAVLSVGLNSCSKDDSPESSSTSSTPSSVQVTINGVAKTFNTVVVNQETHTQGGETITELTVSASINNSADEVITFMVYKGDVGSDAIYSFDYRKNGKIYNSYNSGSLSFSTIIQTNSNNKIVGTFSGGLSYWNNDTQEYEMANTGSGAFNITY
jgi:hypothetical protein